MNIGHYYVAVLAMLSALSQRALLSLVWLIVNSGSKERPYALIDITTLLGSA